MTSFARVKIQVQAEFAIDPVDCLPLGDRQRLIRSGRCDADGLLRNVSPRAILDLFAGDLVSAVRPVSSFFSGEDRDYCNSRQGRSSHRQSYSVMTRGGRSAEVTLNAFIGPTPVSVISNDNVDISQNIAGLSSSSAACQTRNDQKTNSLEPESMPCKFGIEVTIEPSDTASRISSSVDFSCSSSPRNCNLTNISEMNKGDLAHTKNSLKPIDDVDNTLKCSQKSIFLSPPTEANFPSSAKVCKAVSKLETDRISRHSPEIAHNADTGYLQVANSALPSFSKRVKLEPETENVDIDIEKIDSELASIVSLDHGSSSDGGAVFRCDTFPQDIRNGDKIIFPNVAAIHRNQENSYHANDSTLSDAKPTVVGQKRVLCDADKLIRSLPLSPHQTSIKSEPIEESHSYTFQEKVSELWPHSPASDSMSICRRTCSGDPILSEYEESLHFKVVVPSLEEKQPHGNSCNNNESEISRIVETSENNFSTAVLEDPVEPSVISKSLSFPVDVKTEPIETVVASHENLESFLSHSLLVDVKMENIDELTWDEVDHINLKERMKMLVAGRGSSLGHTGNVKCAERVKPHFSRSCAVAAVKSIEKKAGYHRKRKKTATDSVETALEEDAPGLLQVLVEQGIDLDDIKLYGSMEDDDLADVSSEDSFKELENVISQLFIEPSNSLHNLASLQGRKGSKAEYCLACLVSLIEQIQYLQFRQSFIFVFEKHNRIVLERPEYGYATYFFELVDSLPVDWQIKRLVIAMKATYCSRAIIMENKSLMVGQDLTEGEARILEEYGWRPNTGLGSLLNFCDRVVHDRRNESDNSEWKARISKLLMDGHDGGTLTIGNLPKKAMEYLGNQCPVLKLEM